MSTGKLYQEAISDAKDLVRMAEENAKNKLLDAFSPRIRRLVEQKLLSEGDDDVMDIMNSVTDDDSEAEETDASEDSLEIPDEDTSEELSAEDFGEEEFEDLGGLDDLDDLDSEESSDDGEISLKVPKGITKVTMDIGESDKPQLHDKAVEMSNESVKSLLRIMDGRGSLRDRTRSLRLETKMLRRALGALNGRRPNKQAADQIVEEFNAVLRKAIGLKQELKDSGPGSLAEAARNEFNNLLEEISEMSTRTLLRNLLAESNGRKGARRLFEADEEEADAGDDAGEDMDMSDEEGGEEEGGDVDVDAVKSAIEQLASAVGMEVSGSDEEGGDEDMGDDMDMDMGDEEEEVDMAEYDEMATMETGMPMESRRRTAGRRDTVYSIDESMLRRELRRLRRLREEADPMVGSFANAEDHGDSFEDPAELNALVKETDKKGDKDKDKDEEEKEEAKNEARRFRLAAVQEARKNRALKARLSEAAKAVRTLNGQLQEQKLFNAKLLYVNKLMQNRSLSDKQLRAVVEALDSAKTLREAKLLYTSLTESLTRVAKPMTESTNRVAGGSSRPTGSGSTLNESVGETDRWALLAGIKK